MAEQQENSYIGRIGQAVEPIIKPLGFDWKLGIGLISGVGAKELVVSTLGVLYADDADAGCSQSGGSYTDNAVDCILLYAVCSDLFPLYCDFCGY